MTQQNKIRNLTDYFAQVKERPGMYLGTKTITRLYEHLHGYQMAYWFNDIINPVDEKFFNNFNEFVYGYYGVVTMANWKEVILEQCFENEHNALDKFFELYDLFLTEYKPTDTKQVVLSFLDKMIFEQSKMREELGSNFDLILLETIDLIKDHALTKFKYDYELIWGQLNDKARQIPELKSILAKMSI